MSYARFGPESDVYIFTSSTGIECCFCSLQEREWVDDDNAFFKGYFKNVGKEIPDTFKSNHEMIDHLQIHIGRGERVPKYALDRLSDPEDAKENERIWDEASKKSTRDI